jgi:glycosyltransferase involved in cell wall biosynthesis
VLYVAHGHAGRRHGGVESCAALLYRAMREHGPFDPWLVAAGEVPAHANTPWSVSEGDPQQLVFAGGEYDGFWGRLVDRRRCAEDWRELLELVRPDVVHFHHVESLGYDFVRQVRSVCPAAPIVFTLHDYHPICVVNQLVRVPDRQRCLEASPARCHECLPERSTGRHFLRQRWVRAALEPVDRFVSPSEFLKQRYVDWGLDGDRIEVLENARDPLPVAVEREPREQREPADRPPTRFGYFGQISEAKGELVLLRAARILHYRGARVELAIHGANLGLQGRHFQEAFRRELAACPPTVVLHPPYPRKDVGRLMSSIDWVVVPSQWWENSPLVIQEAFGARRPVICSDIGGMAEKVRPGVDGFTFTAGDAAALADTMEDAASSRERWSRLSAATLPPPSPAAAVRSCVAIYLQLLDARRAARVAGEAG